jgi:hypothetical protein
MTVPVDILLRIKHTVASLPLWDQLPDNDPSLKTLSPARLVFVHGYAFLRRPYDEDCPT